jgi:membrane protein DedA with SNARE-associated domain
VFEYLTQVALRWGFPVLMAALMSSGIGVPIPEDIPLLLTGFLCEQKGIPVWHWALGCYGFVMARDLTVFTLGRTLPDRITQSRLFQRVMPPGRQAKVESYFERKGWQTVFAGRFMPGFRSVVFFVAGRSGLSYRTFLLADGSAGLISIPVLVFLGFFFSHNLPALRERVAGIQTIIVLVIIAYLLQSLVRAWMRARRAGREKVDG